MFKNEAWSLDDSESKKLADAASKVLRHHDTPAFSAYAMDWVGLLMVAGNIYAPRIAMTIAARPGFAKATPGKPTPADGPEPQPAQQGPGFIRIRDPLGRGGETSIPVSN